MEAAARVLLLAGTSEASVLAALLVDRPGVEVVASLAGRTAEPVALPCAVRTGGFGGVDGLVRTLREGRYDALVDATHPFAAVMPQHAAEAAAVVGTPRLRVVRPPWRSVPGDDWHEVSDLAEAATALARLDAHRVFLTTGRLELQPFAGLPGVHIVVRSIEPPEPLPLDPRTTTVVLARGPFTIDDERALLRDHRVDTLVTKNSGAEATAAKLVAARALGIRVVMVRRPSGPPGPEVASPDAAVDWLERNILR